MAFGALGRQWVVWKAAWEAESGQHLHAPVSQGPAVEFLPEALDIQRTPPSPIGRTVLWTVLIAAVAVACWAMFLRVDSITRAHGRVVSSGDVKRLYPVEAGVLKAVHVRDGQAVKQGDVLIELDSTRNIAARDHSSKAYRTIQMEVARLRALLKQQPRLEAPAEADADTDEMHFQQQLLQDQLAEHQAKLTAAQHLMEERRAAITQAKEMLLRVKAAAAIETERTERFRKLMEQGVGAKADFLQADHRRLEQLEEVRRQQTQLEQAQAALVEAEQAAHTLAWEFQQAKQAELSALETKAASLAQETTAGERNVGLQQMRSPIDGVVQQLAAQTVGAVVTPAQPLLVVVSLDHSLEVEAQVEQKDLGLAHKGQPVEIKVELFQGRSHEAIPGHILTVPDGMISSKSGEVVAPLRVGLDRSTANVGSTEIKLAPGMSVTVEIKSGPRRMIEYLLDPLFRSGNERLREWNEFVQAVYGFLNRRTA